MNIIISCKIIDLELIFIQRNYYRAGNSRNPSGGSSNGSNNPGVLPPQFVQVEMTNPDDQQFIVYTEWNNKLIYYINGLKHIDTYKIKKKNGTRYYYILGNQIWSRLYRRWLHDKKHAKMCNEKKYQAVKQWIDLHTKVILHDIENLPPKYNEN